MDYHAFIDPIAFSLGPLSVRWYGILMGIAALVGLLLAIREGKKHGLSSDLFLDLVVWVIPAAILGARIYYVLFEWPYYAAHPGDIVAIWKGGLAIHGGLIGGLVAAYLFLRRRHLSLLFFSDLLAPSLILGQAIGRWGNFMNQEAHGGVVTRFFLQKMHLPQWLIEQMNIQGLYYHPTFLYESLWDLGGFLLLVGLRALPLKRGELFFSYLIWYSIGRFMIEGLRTDSLLFLGPRWLEAGLQWFWSPMRAFFAPGMMMDGNIRVAQLVSLLLILLAATMIVMRRSRQDIPDYGA